MIELIIMLTAINFILKTLIKKYVNSITLYKLNVLLYYYYYLVGFVIEEKIYHQ